MCNLGEPVRKYSSYKKEFFSKYEAKARNMRNAVDSLSLKPEDKVKLKKKLGKILED